MEYIVPITALLVTFGTVQAQFGDQNILYILENTHGLSRFASWCREIDYLYTSRDRFTVFAFNDTAYATMPSQDRQVIDQLDASGRINYVRSFTTQPDLGISKLFDKQVLFSLMGKRLYIDKVNIQTSWTTGTSRTFVNGGMIVREDLQASNGVIHVLDRVLSPISNKNVQEYIERPDISEDTSAMQTLMRRLYQDYYSAVAPLAYQDKITFFLPSQAALVRVPDGKLQQLSGVDLSKYFKMHYIPQFAVFTSVAQTSKSYTSGDPQSRIILKKIENRVTVSSGRVTAEVIRGNITVDNGVIHIIDRMLGYVYFRAIEQIQQDAKQFSDLLNSVSPEVMQYVNQGQGLNMFVPIDEAFNYVRHLQGINFDGNITLKEMTARLSIVLDGAVSVMTMGEGGYESRQRRVSRWNGMKIVIFNDRNETWVNAGNTRAKIVRPDVGVINGQLQYIDGILGVPTMDIPTLIYYDDYLLRTYFELQRVHLDQYLKDPRYDASMLPPRSYDANAFANNNYGQQNNYNLYATEWPNQYPTSEPGQITANPNNVPQSVVDQRRAQQNNQYGNQYGNQYPNQGNQYGNQYPNQGNQYGNQYPNQGNQYPNQGNQYPNQYGNQYPNQGNQYPNQGNQYPNQGNQYGNQYQSGQQYWCDHTCGDGMYSCQFTFFVPNGTAIDNFYMRAHYANTIIQDVCRFRFIFRRLIIHRPISLENSVQVGQELVVQSDTGEWLTIRKESENDVRILWKGQSARAIMWDLGATNGIVHVIDQFLSDSDDLHIDISRASYIIPNTVLFIATLLLCLKHILH